MLPLASRIADSTKYNLFVCTLQSYGWGMPGICYDVFLCRWSCPVGPFCTRASFNNPRRQRPRLSPLHSQLWLVWSCEPVFDFRKSLISCSRNVHLGYPTSEHPPSIAAPDTPFCVTNSESKARPAPLTFYGRVSDRCMHIHGRRVGFAPDLLKAAKDPPQEVNPTSSIQDINVYATLGRIHSETEVIHSTSFGKGFAHIVNLSRTPPLLPRFVGGSSQAQTMPFEVSRL